jgi:hypothetical protein
MRSIIFLTVLAVIAVTALDQAEPQLVSETLSGASAVASAVVGWFED